MVQLYSFQQAEIGSIVYYYDDSDPVTSRSQLGCARAQKSNTMVRGLAIEIRIQHVQYSNKSNVCLIEFWTAKFKSYTEVAEFQSIMTLEL